MKDKGSLNWEVSVGVTFASFMSAVTLFFTGVLISQFDNFGDTVKIPILFLIISTFSFIFTAAVYSNAGVEITNNHLEKVQKYLIFANNIFEFLGLHLLILATPLVIGAITEDSFLRIATIAVAVIGLTLYSLSDFSILHKEAKSNVLKFVIVFILIASSLAMYFAQTITTVETDQIYNLAGSTVLIYSALLAIYFSKKSSQYK